MCISVRLACWLHVVQIDFRDLRRGAAQRTARRLFYLLIPGLLGMEEVNTVVFKGWVLVD